MKVLRRVKKDNKLVKKIQIEFVSKDIGTPDAVGEETKNRALEPASFREEVIVNKSQRKAKSKYGICEGFWFDRLGHKAKRSDARFIYIQYVSVIAWVFDFRKFITITDVSLQAICIACTPIASFCSQHGPTHER